MRTVSSITYFCRSGLVSRRSLAQIASLPVELHVLNTLCQRQFLLYGHAQDRIQRFLLLLCSNQLTLQCINLCRVLVTSLCEHRTQRRKRDSVLLECLQLVA
ncbi:hypothetical protein NP493_238g01032 [Ridgeia piscesae]|uniref:Uncharacterized protein n=1 Tax=Ridgeia piscesae TaxID=27915 RepID=A0AAD9NZL1_RIDPI|nr:hypothetical protein NP493_238g01032 [Ridgeia piscesae]